MRLIRRLDMVSDMCPDLILSSCSMLFSVRLVGHAFVGNVQTVICGSFQIWSVY